MEDEFYEPADTDINIQSPDNKQGRGVAIEDEQELSEVKARIHGIHDEAYKVYSELIEKGVAREIARITLPTSLYTQMYWQMDMHNLFHFLWLRMDSHAQKEIRVYAEAMYEMIKEICPLSCEAFEDFQLNKIAIYVSEHSILRELLQGASEVQVREIIANKGLKISEREINEFLQKLDLKRT